MKNFKNPRHVRFALRKYWCGKTSISLAAICQCSLNISTKLWKNTKLENIWKIRIHPISLNLYFKENDVLNISRDIGSNLKSKFNKTLFWFLNISPMVQCSKQQPFAGIILLIYQMVCVFVFSRRATTHSDGFWRF